MMLNFQCIWRGVTAKRNAIGKFVFLGNYIKIYHMLLFNWFPIVLLIIFIFRLQLNDFLIKPMQRLTKYSLILQRIINHSRVESETSCLEEMVLS